MPIPKDFLPTSTAQAQTSGPAGSESRMRGAIQNFRVHVGELAARREEHGRYAVENELIEIHRRLGELALGITAHPPPTREKFGQALLRIVQDFATRFDDRTWQRAFLGQVNPIRAGMLGKVPERQTSSSSAVSRMANSSPTKTSAPQQPLSQPRPRAPESRGESSADVSRPHLAAQAIAELQGLRGLTEAGRPASSLMGLGQEKWQLAALRQEMLATLAYISEQPEEHQLRLLDMYRQLTQSFAGRSESSTWRQAFLSEHQELERLVLTAELTLGVDSAEYLASASASTRTSLMDLSSAQVSFAESEPEVEQLHNFLGALAFTSGNQPLNAEQQLTVQQALSQLLSEMRAQPLALRRGMANELLMVLDFYPTIFSGQPGPLHRTDVITSILAAAQVPASIALPRFSLMGGGGLETLEHMLRGADAAVQQVKNWEDPTQIPEAKTAAFLQDNPIFIRQELDGLIDRWRTSSSPSAKALIPSSANALLAMLLYFRKNLAIPGYAAALGHRLDEVVAFAKTTATSPQQASAAPSELRVAAPADVERLAPVGASPRVAPADVGSLRPFHVSFAATEPEVHRVHEVASNMAQSAGHRPLTPDERDILRGAMEGCLVAMHSEPKALQLNMANHLVAVMDMHATLFFSSNGLAEGPALRATLISLFPTTQRNLLPRFALFSGHGVDKLEQVLAESSKVLQQSASWQDASQIPEANTAAFNQENPAAIRRALDSLMTTWRGAMTRFAREDAEQSANAVLAMLICYRSKLDVPDFLAALSHRVDEVIDVAAGKFSEQPQLRRR